MKVKAGLLIDLGNSETRMTLLIDKSEKTTILSNRFAALPPKYSVPVDYRNKKTSIIGVNSAYYAHGHLAEREFSDKLIRPTSVEHKSTQLVTELSIHLVLLNALVQLSEACALPISDLDVTFDISVMLPPMEHDIDSETIKQTILGIKKVTSLMPYNVEAQIKIEDVNVSPEGVAAFFGVCFNETDGALVEAAENLDYFEGYVLILDIGAGTTDAALIKDSELVLNSKDTFNKGGNTVESNLKNALKRKYGFVPQDIGVVVSTGELREGGVVHDVSDLVTKAKDSYTNVLMPDITSYLERMAIAIKEVKGILVVGGGSLPSIKDDKVVSPAMSEVLLSYLRKLAPNLTVVSLCNKDPRLVNIEGLKFIHRYAR